MNTNVRYSARLLRVLERLGDVEAPQHLVAQGDGVGSDFSPIPCSARPGTGSVRETEPSATIMWS